MNQVRAMLLHSIGMLVAMYQIECHQLNSSPMPNTIKLRMLRMNSPTKLITSEMSENFVMIRQFIVISSRFNFSSSSRKRSKTSINDFWLKSAASTSINIIAGSMYTIIRPITRVNMPILSESRLSMTCVVRMAWWRVKWTHEKRHQKQPTSESFNCLFVT